MKIDYISSDGIQQAEKEALSRIKDAFNSSSLSRSWHGFAGFEMIDRVHRDREIDLVLLTHDRVLLVELKNWHGAVTPMKDHWLRNGQDMGRSAVKVIAAKLKIFASKMKRYLPDPVRSSWNEYRVIFCGSENYLALPEDERAYIVRLEEFAKISTPGNYIKMFGHPRTGAINPSSYINDFSKFIRGPEFKATNFSFNNFQLDGDAVFEHGRGLYKEYKSLKKDDARVQALLRRWDFSVLAGTADTVDERAYLALREHKVLGYVQDVSEPLFSRFLQPLSYPTRDDVNADFCELYRLPARQLRLSNFVHKHATAIPPHERLSMVKALLSHFADLHDLGIAHRDIGEHTLWLERPSQVSVSGMLTAYFPEAGTVGNLQKFINAGSVQLPEDTEGFGEGVHTTPFTRDVFLLGVVAHILLLLRRPSLSQDLGIYCWEPAAEDPFNGTMNSWLERSLDLVPDDRFANAREMLKELNRITALSRASEATPDFSAFEIYRTDVLPITAYPIENNIKQGRTHVYQSNAGPSKVCVKLWYGLTPDQRRPGEAHRLLRFLELVQTFKAGPSPSLPDIVDFGISQAGTYLVSEWIQGVSLDLASFASRSQRATLAFCERLADSLDSLHTSGLAHGDLSPEHIFESGDQIRFIDALDFSPESEAQPFNLIYGPPQPESVPAQQRDCFAAAKMMSELLATCPDRELDDAKLRDEIALCLRGDNGLYRLERILVELRSLIADRTNEILSLSAFDRIGDSQTVASDNGTYHINLFQDQKSADNVMLAVTGIRSQLLLKLDKRTRMASWSRSLEIPHSQFVQQANRAVAKLSAQITIVPGREQDYSAVAAAALAIPSVSEAFEDLTGAEAPEKVETQTTLVPATMDIWKGLIEAEEATLPEVVIAGTVAWDMNRGDRIRVPYSKAGEPLDYGVDDQINVLQNRNGEAIRIGVLNTEETTPTTLVIDRVERSLKQSIGTSLLLQSAQDRASFQKRRAAALRIAERKSVIPNLLDFFDPAINSVPTAYAGAPTDEELDIYDVHNGTQRIFSLNAQQREAFRRLWANGPVSLLQGPPGTGKTAFIASFIHYAFGKGAKQILLASQSHEAVNNAAEKFAELCERKETQIGIVRFGSEGMVSDALRPYHVNAILSNYREQFRAEMRERISSLSSNLGLPLEYVNEWWKIESQLGQISRELSHVIRKLEQGLELPKSRRESLERTIEKRTALFKRVALSQFGVDAVDSSEELLSRLHAEIVSKYRIISPDAIRRLERVAHLSQEWIDRLATLRGNFEEFLAKTRNLVCGTCVGLGRTEFGIVNTAYDWVIIDEAARATPGELAVALQTGRRVLLVGDHRQLPPLYTREAIDHMAMRFVGTERTTLMRSDFERAFESTFGHEVGATLQTQYRMAPPIGELVSDCFYPNRLLPGRQNASTWLKELPGGLKSTVTWIDTSAALGQAFERKRPNHGFDNPYEARVILSLLKRISSDDALLNRLSNLATGDRECIGIICMYADQKTLLQKLLSEQEWAVGIKDLLKVDTVDSYQGKENPIIIVSLTRNNDRYDQGFLRAPERINVAVSRAMERVVLVGAARMWSQRNANAPLGKVLSFVQERHGSDDFEIFPAESLMKGAPNGESRTAI